MRIQQVTVQRIHSERDGRSLSGGPLSSTPKSMGNINFKIIIIIIYFKFNMLSDVVPSFSPLGKQDLISNHVIGVVLMHCKQHIMTSSV